MIGIILCGGAGKRLRPLTDEVPKTMLELKDGYTILDKQLLDFANAGINRAILLTGYLSDKIEKRYGNSYRGVKIEYNVEKEPLGTLNAIRQGMKKAKDDALVRNGDIVTDLNIKRMIKHFESTDFLATMFITRMRSPYGIVEIEGDRIRSFREKPLLEQHINGGVYCLSRDMPYGDFDGGEIEKTVFPVLADSAKLGYYKEDVFWIAVDTVKDLEEVRKEYSNRTDKPWGYEKILVSTEKYLTKELYIKEGYGTSYHLHKKKDETLYVMSGSIYVEFKKGKEYHGRNDTIRIKPNTPHTIAALENSIVHEVSTPHLDDTTRIKDFYVR